MTDITARRLVAGTAALVATDVVGGLLAVAGDVNTWSEAWGGEALLAAPAPMIAVQLLLTWAAARRTGRTAVVAAAVFALACLVSVASGFFDGGLGNDELDGPLVGYQVFLLTVTAVVGVLAAMRAVAARARTVVTDDRTLPPVESGSVGP
jgi:hypothetical protein